MSDRAANQPGIVLLCGRSFAGKSTVAATLAEGLPAKIISLDEINSDRGLRSGEGVPLEEWSRTHDLAHEQTRRTVAAGETVVVDDTSSLRFLRDRWRSLADELGVRLVLVYLDTPIAVSLARHAANRVDSGRADVTDGILEGHLASFEPPGEDEHPVRIRSDAAERASLLTRIREPSLG